MSSEAPKSKRWTVLSAIIAVIGLLLVLTPLVAMPQNVVSKETLSDSNNYTALTTVTLEPGDYEIWLTKSFWSFFNLDQPLVSVDHSDNSSVHVDIVLADKDRRFDGEEFRLVAEFTIDTKDSYTVEVEAPLTSVTFTGTNMVYLTEARSSLYAPMLWTGVILLIIGICLGIAMAVQRTVKKGDEALNGSQPPRPQPPPPYSYPYQQPPPQPYPPPYPPYQQQPYPPPHPQYQQRPYPPQGGQPPPSRPPPQGEPPEPSSPAEDDV